MAYNIIKYDSSNLIILNNIETLNGKFISNKQLNQIDLTEAFKSDDQIGFFFRNLQNIQDSLNHYLRN